MTYRTKNRLLLAKAETTSGTDASPTAASDAVYAEQPMIEGGLQSLNTDEATGTLDSKAPVPGGGGGTFRGTVNLRGAGTAGVAPEWGVFLRAAGFAETTPTVLSNTAQAGAASTITLHSGASASDDIYNGRVIVTTGGTGPGQTRVIHDYVGSTKVATVYPDWTTQPDNTTTFTIYPCALYLPASQDIPTLSMYLYQRNELSSVNSRLRKLLGAAFNAQFTLPNKALAKMALNGVGKFVTPTDVSDPGLGTFDTQRPIAFMGATISLGGVATKFNQLTFDLGNQVQQADDPSDTFGVDVGGITQRLLTGKINPPLSLLSARNVWADFLGPTPRQLWVQYGGTAGNRLSFYFPSIQYTGNEDENVNGFAHEGIPFASTIENDAVRICVY